jgi:hypothetical protein
VQLQSRQLREYVETLVNANVLPTVLQDPKLVTLSLRHQDRRVLNVAEVSTALQQFGYTVEVVYFDQLTFTQQIKQMRRTRFLIGSYGSNLANGIFLQPGGSVIVCWPNPDVKQFWSRRYCVIHAALLALGIVVHELDKSTYDVTSDKCTSVNAQHPEDVYRDGNLFRLKAEKNTAQTALSYCSYDLLLVDFAVDLSQLRELFQKLHSNVQAVQLQPSRQAPVSCGPDFTERWAALEAQRAQLVKRS